MKLYIAGPMTGLPEFNYPAFNAAAKALAEVGYETLNPVDNVPDVEKPTWLDFMRMSLVQISQADGLAVLPGWQDSRGADIEVTLANDLGLPVRMVRDWTETTPAQSLSTSRAQVPQTHRNGPRSDAHVLTEYGTTSCPLERVRAEVDEGVCSACGATVEGGQA